MLPSFQDTEPRFITMLKQSLPSHWQYERHVIDYNNSFGHDLNIWLRKRTCQGLDSRYGETHCLKCDTANAGAYGFDSEALFVDYILKEIKAIDMHDFPPRKSLKDEFEEAVPLDLYKLSKDMKHSIKRIEKTIIDKKILLLI